MPPAKKILDCKFLPGAVAAVLLTGYFFWFAGDNLRVEFTHDDLMNTYRAWLASWKSLWLDNVVFFRPTPVYRPLPEMAYKLSFLAFGFDLLPFRILLTGLLLANAFLVFLFGASVGHSKLAGMIAAAVVVYHPNDLAALYYSTGLCFDIFCFFFYFVSLIVYLRLRSRPTAPLALAFLLSYVCALNSKEMAVSLPVAMFFIELLFFRLGGDYRRATLISWPFRQGKWVSIAALMALLFILGRVLSANGLVNAGGYRIDLSLHEYLNHAAAFLSQLLLRRHAGEAFAWLLLAVIWSVPCVLRSRAGVFGTALFTFGILPVAFIQPRTLDAIYIPMAGLALWAGVMIARIADGVLAPLPQLARAAVVFLLIAMVPARAYAVHEDIGAFSREYAQIRSVREQLKARYPAIRPGSRILFLTDPFGRYEWATLFITRLVYRDESITVDRLSRLSPPPDQTAIGRYDYVFTFDKDVLVDARKEPFRISNPISIR